MVASNRPATRPRRINLAVQDHLILYFILSNLAVKATADQCWPICRFETSGPRTWQI